MKRILSFSLDGLHNAFCLDEYTDGTVLLGWMDSIMLSARWMLATKYFCTSCFSMIISTKSAISYFNLKKNT